MTNDTSLGLLARLVRLSPAAYGYVGIASLLETVPGIAVSLLIGLFVDEVLVAANGAWTVPITVGLIATIVVVASLSSLQYRVLARLAVRLSATESTRFAWHALRIPVPAISEFGTGDLAARSGSIQRQSFLSGLLIPLALGNVIAIVIYTVFILALNAVLGLVGLLVVAGSVVVSTLLLRRRRVLQDRSDAARVALSSVTTQTIGSIEDIKAAAWEPWIFNRWSQHRSAQGQATSDLAMDGQRLGLVSPLTQTVGLGLVLAVGSLLVFVGDLSIGTLAATQTMLLAILIPVGQLVWIGTLIESVNSIQRQVDAVSVIPLDVEVVARPSRGASSTTSGAMSLTLLDVTFGYDPGEVPLLDRLTLDVPPGSWLAIVGSSGSGKSTLSRLTVGELQPWSGAVLLDGIHRLDLPRSLRTGRLGYVPQYPVLMPGTIAENVTMFDESIPVERVHRALIDAQVAYAVNARPGGIEERVSATGHGFSGGELQRLAIARALVRDPDLLILDESTSALDPLVEVDVINALRARGCTCVLVAHRLSTVRDADRIVVLERGQIVQAGTFDELIGSGRFAELAHG